MTYIVMDMKRNKVEEVTLATADQTLFVSTEF